MWMVNILKKTSFLDKALILTAVSTIIFFTVILVMFAHTGLEPETTVNAFKDIVCMELGGGGIIQIAKARRIKNEQQGICTEDNKCSEEL